MWFGAIGTIPNGWFLCDGTLGTPDLRDKFIVAAGGSFAPDDLGGAASHTEFTSGDGHDHGRLGGSDIAGGPGNERRVNASNVDGISDPSSNLSPYYALAYVMFLG